jgi:hypothetical protein
MRGARKMVKHLTASALGFSMILLLAACSSTPVAPPAKIITETEYVTPPAPIVPNADPLDLRDVEFIIVTKDNIDEVFEKLKGDKVLFGLTPKNYENIALNLSDLRAYIAQQKSIIILYENSYDE